MHGASRVDLARAKSSKTGRTLLRIGDCGEVTNAPAIGRPKIAKPKADAPRACRMKILSRCLGSGAAALSHSRPALSLRSTPTRWRCPRKSSRALRSFSRRYPSAISCCVRAVWPEEKAPRYSDPRRPLGSPSRYWGLGAPEGRHARMPTRSPPQGIKRCIQCM
jgi:hypothetical protein